MIVCKKTIDVSEDHLELLNMGKVAKTENVWFFSLVVVVVVIMFTRGRPINSQTALQSFASKMISLPLSHLPFIGHLYHIAVLNLTWSGWVKVHEITAHSPFSAVISAVLKVMFQSDAVGGAASSDGGKWIQSWVIQKALGYYFTCTEHFWWYRISLDWKVFNYHTVPIRLPHLYIY